MNYLMQGGVCLIFLLSPILISSVYGITLAEVNHRPISDRAVTETLHAYLRQIGHQELSNYRIISLRKEILKKLIEKEMLYQYGLKEGHPVSEKEIETGIARIRSRFPSTKAFRAAILKESLKMDDIRVGVYRAILIQKTWEKLSHMTEAERVDRLKTITKGSDVQVFDPEVSFAGHKTD